MTVQEFQNEWSGELIKSPHGILGQCVSIPSQFAVENGWPELWPGETAFSIFNNNLWRDAYERVLNTPDNFPVTGDFVFFKAPPYGLYFDEDDRQWKYAGHIGLCVRADVNQVTLFQQDDPAGSVAHETNYTYDSVAGWFHPKALDNQGGEMEKFNEGDRINLNVYLYGKDLGRFKPVVGQDWKKAMYELFESPEYKTDALVNKGDVPAINDVYATTDGASTVGMPWKELFYQFATQHKVSADKKVQVFVTALKDLLK
jgi:hypothetical protein